MENTIFIHTLQQAKDGDTSAQEQIILKFQPMMHTNVMQWNMRMLSRS